MGLRLLRNNSYFFFARDVLINWIITKLSLFKYD